MVRNLLYGVGFWIALKRSDDATDGTTVGRACCGIAEVYLGNPLRDICQQQVQVQLVWNAPGDTPAADAFRAELMPVLASTTAFHRAETKTANTYTHILVRPAE